MDRTNQKGIFLACSRLNHSCVPNAYFDYNEQRGLLIVYATQDIEQNAEITVSYVLKAWKWTTEARFEELRDSYGFTCDCGACSTAGDIGRLRQNHRDEIMALVNDAKAYR